MTQHNKRSGGRRAGSGRHRRRIYLNKEAANILAGLLAQQRVQLKQPELNEDDVVCNLITNASEQNHTMRGEALQLVQEAIQKRWQEMLPRLISEFRSQFDSTYVEMIQQIQEEVNKKWWEADSKTE